MLEKLIAMRPEGYGFVGMEGSARVARSTANAAWISDWMSACERNRDPGGVASRGCNVDSSITVSSSFLPEEAPDLVSGIVKVEQ